jgi:ABC-type phosphate/phosphonate transport system permease subunit
MDELNQILIETAERAKSNTHRIDELAKEHAAIHELALSVRELAVETKSIREDVTAQKLKIEALEQLPAQRWNSMVKTLVTSVATTILGGIVGAVLALVLK